jgi:hypothetical protein
MAKRRVQPTKKSRLATADEMRTSSDSHRSRAIPTVPYSRKDFAKGKGKEAISAATIPFRKFKRAIRGQLRKGNFAGAKRTAKALGLDESLLPDSYPILIDKIIKKKIKKKKPSAKPSAETTAISAASDARAEEKSELDEAVEKRKKLLANPRLLGRLSLLSGSELGLLGG